MILFCLFLEDKSIRSDVGLVKYSEYLCLRKLTLSTIIEFNYNHVLSPKIFLFFVLKCML